MNNFYNEIPFFTERVNYIESIKDKLIALKEEYGSPLYVFDSIKAKESLDNLKNAFSFGVEPKIFFAVKSNPYIGLSKLFVESGIGLDVSSDRELNIALEAHAKKIIFSGPGKNSNNIKRAIETGSFIHIDSFNELKLIGEFTNSIQEKVECGVRISTVSHGRWSKFGIKLESLKEFLEVASKYRNLKIIAIQSHQSMTSVPEDYTNVMEEIAEYLTVNLNENQRKDFKILDIGGGYPAPSFQGTYPWNPELDLLFDNSSSISKILNDEFVPRFTLEKNIKIEFFAEAISKTFKENFTTLRRDFELWLEPGSFLSNQSLHLLMTIADIKDSHTVIMDAGTNTVGYERYQYVWYVPTFNLTNFSKNIERPVVLYGSLCTPNDIWSYYLYGSSLNIGDTVLIPFQGDYTITYSQSEFIHPLPKIVEL